MAATPQARCSVAGGVIHVNGPLVFDTASDVLSQSLPLLPAQGTAIIDLSGVPNADSTALALLVEWRRISAQRALVLELRGLPAQLRALATATGLDALCR